MLSHTTCPDTIGKSRKAGKTFLQILFFFLLVTQVCFGQLEFLNNEQQQKISSEQLTNALSVNLDSLMLDSIIIAYKNSQSIPGIATMIVKDNEVIWNKNYGYRNLQNQLPVEDSTIFLMASISKTILATAVMQLWENGMINLENNINNYLPPGFTVKNPFYPNDSITVKMLLVHTSSIRDDYNLFPINAPFLSCGDFPMRLDSFLVNYLMPGGTYYSPGNFYNYHPGQQWNYSNAGASLLAVMIEYLTGKSFSEYCRDSIFIPLSMNSTSWFLEGLNINNIATPYNVSNPVCHQGWVLYPSGFLRTNKIDLSKFLLAYINNGVYNNFRILDSTTISYMLSDQLGYNVVWEAPWWKWKQGLIWWNVFPIKKNSWGHVGSWYGCLTYMSYDPIEKWGTIWFQNWRLSDNIFTRLGEINYPFTNYAHLYGNIYAQNSNVEKRYAKISIDSVLFKTRFSNIYNHQFTAHLTYANSDSTLKDSLSLFDDGLHGDLLSNDGIYGGYIPPQQTEDFYSLGVSTIDNLTNKYFNTPDICKFTTVGPIVLDSISCTKTGTYYLVKPFVRNQSTNTTITNAFVSLICDDPWVLSISPNARYLPNIPPGGVVSNPVFFTVRQIDSLFQFHNYFNFKVEVLSNGWTYWVDSIKMIVTGVDDELQQPLTFKLEQNYPNPFNPSTKISWQSPVSSWQTLKIYDVLGNEIVTLVNEEKEAGSYEVEFNAEKLSSGVYFYQLKVFPANGGVGSFVQTRKMILTK